MEYGQIAYIKLYKYIWKNILRFLHETQWYKLKLVCKSFYYLIKESCQEKSIAIDHLVKNNLVESMICRTLLFDDSETYLKMACLYGNLEMSKLIIKKYPKEYNYDVCFEYSCFIGHIQLVELFIQKNINNWNKGLIIACEMGHINLAILMIDKGASHLNAALTAACQGNYQELVCLLIQKGANYCFNCHKNNYYHTIVI